MPTHVPFRIYEEIKGADAITPTETAFNDPSPPPQKTWSFNRGGADKKWNGPIHPSCRLRFRFESRSFDRIVCLYLVILRDVELVSLGDYLN